MGNITYRIEPISVQMLLDSLSKNRIQRWDDVEVGRGVSQEKRASYITSVMAGVPIIPLVFDGTKSPWVLLDGRKRFSVLWGFYNNKFQVSTSEYFKFDAPKYYMDLTMFMKRKFCSTKIPCIVISTPTTLSVIDDIQKRLKTSL